MDSAWFENALLESDEFTNDPNLLREDVFKLLIIIAFILPCILFKKIIVVNF
jgi:hypothetical protein